MISIKKPARGGGAGNCKAREGGVQAGRADLHIDANADQPEVRGLLDEAARHLPATHHLPANKNMGKSPQHSRALPNQMGIPIQEQ